MSYWEFRMVYLRSSFPKFSHENILLKKKNHINTWSLIAAAFVLAKIKKTN